MRHWIVFVLVLAAGGFAAGCRQSAAPTAPAALQAADITVAFDPNPPSVGDATLRVTVMQDGAPLVDAPVSVRGDMNHAGMKPVIASATTGSDGKVEVPFSWSMGGDWIVTVTVTLPDGSEVSQDFNYTVTS